MASALPVLTRQRPAARQVQNEVNPLLPAAGLDCQHGYPVDEDFPAQSAVCDSCIDEGYHHLDDPILRGLQLRIGGRIEPDGLGHDADVV
jgi:hypothetical protein